MWTDIRMWKLKDTRQHIKRDWVSSLRKLAATVPGKIAYMHFLLEAPYGILKQGLLQRNGEPYPDFASPIATFDRQTLHRIHKDLKP